MQSFAGENAKSPATLRHSGSVSKYGLSRRPPPKDTLPPPPPRKGLAELLRGAERARLANCPFCRTVIVMESSKLAKVKQFEQFLSGEILEAACIGANHVISQ